MRYLHRTHGVSVAWLHEVFGDKKNLDLVYEASDSMCADIYTKAFTDKVKWGAVCGLINVVEPKALSQLVQTKAAMMRADGDQSPGSSPGRSPRKDESSSDAGAPAATADHTGHVTFHTPPAQRGGCILTPPALDVSLSTTDTRVPPNRIGGEVTDDDPDVGEEGLTPRADEHFVVGRVSIVAPAKAGEQAGWTTDGLGRPVLIAHHAHAYRTPTPRFPKEEWPRRSTWTWQKTGWKLLVDGIDWTILRDSHALITPPATCLYTRLRRQVSGPLQMLRGGSLLILPGSTEWRS